MIAPPQVHSGVPTTDWLWFLKCKIHVYVQTFSKNPNNLHVVIVCNCLKCVRNVFDTIPPATDYSCHKSLNCGVSRSYLSLLSTTQQWMTGQKKASCPTSPSNHSSGTKFYGVELIVPKILRVQMSVQEQMESDSPADLKQACCSSRVSPEQGQ